MLNILLYILFINVSTIIAKDDSKLLFVQILWRHGDRTPITLYPNDPNPETVWREGLGQLTMLGKRQHYNFGKFLKQMYGNFTTSNPNEVDVISSDCDRCLLSAETNLAAFFAPSDEWKFDKHLYWQPIPVYYIPRDVDKYLEVESDCPRAFEESKRIVHSPEGQAFIAKHKEMFENLTVNSGTPITNWTSASYLYDALFIEKKYNLTVPAWANPYWNELKSVSDLSFYWSFNSPLLHRLRAGPLLGRIIEKMKSKISGDIPLQKVQIYSAHDTNIALVLGAFNLFNMKAPPYCSSLLFELFEMSDGVKAVRLLFLNSTEPETEMQDPHILILEGCSEFCPLDYFINYTQPIIPDDWEEECQLDTTLLKKLKDKYATIGLFLALMVVVVIIMSACSMWKLYYRDRDKYAYHLMQMS